jgi:glycosyltransferase involved in cell wall biosynthesis
MNSFFGSKKEFEKLNICLITKKFPYPGRGGEDNYLWPMARGLADRGHDVTVLTWTNPRGRAELITQHFRAYFLGEKKGVNVRQFPTLAYRKFLELHLERPFQIVHSLDESGALIGRDRKNLKFMMTYDVSATQMAQLFSILGMAHETLGSLLSTGFALCYKFLTTYFASDRQILKTADGMFVATPQQKIMLERYYMYPDLKTFVVPYGMDHIETEIRPVANDLRTRFGLPDGAQIIVTQTDMTEFEVIANLMRAFQKVVIKKPNARLVIIGSGPLKNEIEFECLNLVLGNRTHFVGPLSGDDTIELLAISDIYANLSSRTTGFEPAMLEAMAQKKTVIGSELSPMATIIEEGQNGFLVRPADIEGLTEVITRLLNNELSLKDIGERAHQKVIDLFNVDKMVDLIVSAYQQLIQNRPLWRTLAKSRVLPADPPSISSPS